MQDEINDKQLQEDRINSLYKAVQDINLDTLTDKEKEIIVAKVKQLLEC